MPEFEWVKARHSCSIGDAFETLKLDVRADVISREKLRLDTEPEGHRYYAFDFKTSDHTFSVFVNGTPEVKQMLHKSVMFALETDSISITKEGKGKITVRVDLDREGQCVFKVDGVDDTQYKSWQLRKFALDDLFFQRY